MTEPEFNDIETEEGLHDTVDLPQPPQPYKYTKDYSTGWANKTLRGLNKGVRAITLNQPLIGAALMALGMGYAGHKLGPWIDRVLSPKLIKSVSGKDVPEDDEDEYRTPEERAEQRKFWMYGLGGLGALAFLATQARPNAPYWGLTSYRPMSKKGSAYDYLTIEDSIQQIIEDPTLDPVVKQNSLILLRSFDKPATQPVTGGDLVGQAISTGISGMKGAAVGYLTANALGLPNPKSTAILGAIANTLGVGPALATSVIFGQ